MKTIQKSYPLILSYPIISVCAYCHNVYIKLTGVRGEGRKLNVGECVGLGRKEDKDRWKVREQQKDRENTWLVLGGLTDTTGEWRETLR